MLKSHESMVENHWELCRMINHMVNDYDTLDIDLRGQLENMDWTLDWTLDWTWTGLWTGLGLDLDFIKRILRLTISN